MTLRRTIEAPAGYRTPEVALYVAQMDDQSRRLTDDTRGLTPAELAWQPAPGMNTIGMLLAHIALVELWWTSVLMQVEFRPEILGVGEDDDGMPLAPGGKPPATLEGKDLRFFDDLLQRVREHLKRSVATLAPADVEAEVEKRAPDGTPRILNKRWILYHMLEHLAGHYGQINLLRHQYRESHESARAAR